MVVTLSHVQPKHHRHEENFKQNFNLQTLVCRTSICVHMVRYCLHMKCKITRRSGGLWKSPNLESFWDLFSQPGKKNEAVYSFIEEEN